MAIAYVGNTTYTYSAHRKYHRFSHAVGAGSDRLLLVGVQSYGNDYAILVTYGEQALSLLGRYTPGVAFNTTIELWGLVNPPVGTADVLVTMNGAGQNYACIAALDYTGVDQTNPVATVAVNNAASGTACSCNITTVTDNAVIMGVKAGDGGDTYPHAPGAGVTERVDAQSGTSTSYDGGFCAGDMAAAAAGAYTWSVTQNVDDNWAVVVAELVEAGSGIATARRVTQALAEVDLGIRVPLRVTQVLLEVDIELPPDTHEPGSVGRIGAPRGQVAPWRYRRPGGGGSAAAAVHVGRVATHQGPPAHPRVLEPRLSRRDFTPTLATPGLSLRVERLSWRAMGGPHLATIRAGGDVTALWSLVEALRCPVEIFDPHGAARWWGYVAEVEVEVEGIALTASLDTMANRVAVAYAYSTGDAVGSRATTAWAQDDDSVLEFGTVERLESSSSSDSADATQLRDVTLARVRWPQTAARLTPGAGAVGATLECRGWWDTLRWRHYDNPDVATIETTDEVAAVVADVGEFLEGTLIDDASGVLVSPYEDGDRTAQDVIADLLAYGTANDRRMLAAVTRERYLRLYEEPAAGSGDYLLLADGSLRDRYNRRLAPGECPVGVWARLKDVLPATLDLTRLTDPGLVMLDETEWDEGQQRIANIVTRVDDLRLVTLEAR